MAEGTHQEMLSAIDCGVPQNRLYYGDNLDVLRRYVADESVDLVCQTPRLLVFAEFEDG